LRRKIKDIDFGLMDFLADFPFKIGRLFVLCLFVRLEIQTGRKILAVVSTHSLGTTDLQGKFFL
jgi:hypothetical protein